MNPIINFFIRFLSSSIEVTIFLQRLNQIGIRKWLVRDKSLIFSLLDILGR